MINVIMSASSFAAKATIYLSYVDKYPSQTDTLPADCVKIYAKPPDKLRIDKELMVHPPGFRRHAWVGNHLIVNGGSQIEIGPGWYDEHQTSRELAGIQCLLSGHLRPDVVFSTSFLSEFTEEHDDVDKSKHQIYFKEDSYQGQPVITTVSLQPNTGLISRISYCLGSRGNSVEVTRVNFTDWTLNQQIDDGIFEIKAPAGAVQVDSLADLF
jgi:hypothetical protein